jgi:hypothetical protein
MMTFSIMLLRNECRYAENHDYLNVILSVVMLNVVMLSVVAPFRLTIYRPCQHF